MMKEMALPRFYYTEQSIPVGINKCPKHGTWIKKKEYGRVAGEPDVRWRTRYCEMCDTEKVKEQEQRAKEAGAAPKSKLRIMTL